MIPPHLPCVSADVFQDEQYHELNERTNRKTEMKAHLNIAHNNTFSDSLLCVVTFFIFLNKALPSPNCLPYQNNKIFLNFCLKVNKIIRHEKKCKNTQREKLMKVLDNRKNCPPTINWLILTIEVFENMILRCIYKAYLLCSL